MPSAARPLDDALVECQSTRDRRAKPMYDFTCQLATLEPPPPSMQRLFAALHGNQDATLELYSALTGSRPLPAFMNPEKLDRIMRVPELEGDAFPLFESTATEMNDGLRGVRSCT
jgi:hypothetical protein